MTVIDVAKALGGLLLILSGVYLGQASLIGWAMADILVGAYLLWTSWVEYPHNPV